LWKLENGDENQKDTTRADFKAEEEKYSNAGYGNGGQKIRKEVELWKI
jgi:hypothetical protein